MVCFFLGWIALSNLPSITHCEELKFTQESSLEGEWLSKKQALDAIGAEELKMRVQAGTIRTRRNKEDSRFWEFRLQTEKDSFRTTKEVSTKVKSELGAQKEDVLQFGAMQREALTAEDFDLEAPSSSSKGVNDDLARFLGISTSKDEKNKTPKENKWELESKVRSQSTKATMEKQLMKFKSEMAKEENLLETTLVDAKSVSLEQKSKMTLTKAVKQELAKLSTQKTALSAMLSKKSLKVGDVKEVLASACQILTEAKKVRVRSQKAVKDAEDEED